MKEQERKPIDWAEGAISVIGRVVAWLSEVITLWRCMTFGSVVFAAGISGTWFNGQFADDLGSLYWGWFGAGLVGLCLFAGVSLAIQGMFGKEWVSIGLGVGLILVGVVVDATMGAQYFGGKHEGVTQIVLGLFAPVTAVLCGAAEAVQEWRKGVKQEEKETTTLSMQMELQIRLAEVNAQIQADKERAIETERIKSDERRHGRELQLQKALAVPVIQPPSVNVHVQESSSVNIRELTSDEKIALDTIRTRLGDVFTSSQVEEVSPLGRTKTYEVLKLSQERGILEKEERGKWRFK